MIRLSVKMNSRAASAGGRVVLSLMRVSHLGLSFSPYPWIQEDGARKIQAKVGILEIQLQ